MDKQRTVTVNIINRNYPPKTGITGESAAELAAHLLENNVTVNVFHVDANYHGGESIDTGHGNIFSVRAYYNGKNKILRLFGNLIEGFLLVRKSKSVYSDVTICMTDPPLLNLWASWLLGKKRRWILWSMDLYPEAFVAGDLISEGNIFYRFIDRTIRKRKPWHVIALGKYQADYLKMKYGKDLSVTNLPCGIYTDQEIKDEASPPWALDTSLIYLGYCGNMGEAHSADFLISVIDYLDPAKYKLVLAMYGSKAQRVMDYATGKPGIEILSYVKRNELKFIDIHLSSLDTNWINVCVPSKTVSSVCAGAAFLYHGNENSDNWYLLSEAGWIIRNTEADANVKTFLNDLSRPALNEKKQSASQVASRLLEMKKKAFDEINKKIHELN